jgi:aryl-alcohol dehydrogenase-like predicted oxidoreductase
MPCAATRWQAAGSSNKITEPSSHKKFETGCNTSQSKKGYEFQMFKRILGRSGIEVSALGLGCWAIGGPFSWNGVPKGWGQVDDAQSIRAIHRALELGITLFDTAAVYGAGHSERVLGRALAGKREDVTIATKFGIEFDEATRQITGINMRLTGRQVRTACEESLRRLGTDYIDIYHLHPAEYSLEHAGEVRSALEDLVQDGLIRTYGWSITSVDGLEIFAAGKHCGVTQNELNVMSDPVEFRLACEAHNIGWLCRGPLGMGLLTGKYDRNSAVADDDIRKEWDLSEKGKETERLNRLARIQTELKADGRTLAQGALAWVWARSELAVPIPGFKNEAQVLENVAAAGFGALDAERMVRIDDELCQFGPPLPAIHS